MKPLLSILICSLSAREQLYRRLADILAPQVCDEVEILRCEDDGEMPIGKKRNKLLDTSTGEYIAYVDDDDIVSNDYISSILEVIKRDKPDCVGLTGVILFQGNYPRRFIHTLECTAWYEENAVFYRNPNHLNPVRRRFADTARFNDMLSFGEDADYSSRLVHTLRSETLIEKPIYYYISNKYQFLAGTNRENIKQLREICNGFAPIQH